METEESGLAAILEPERGNKWPPSPATLSDDGDGSKPSDDDADGSNATDDDGGGEWLVSGSEEEDEDHEEGTLPPYTVDDIPRPGCDHKKQSDVMFRDPNVELRGPLPIRLFPAFKDGKGKHYFGSDYNLADKSQISVDSVEDCANECHCFPMQLLQFIDIKIAGYQHTHPGRAKVYGFIAARERSAPLRNYVYRREIENCESVFVKRKTGVARLSLTGPPRVISMPVRALIEFEIHARSEYETTAGDGDVIIEGCTQLENVFTSKASVDHRRLYGERCALDIKYMVLIGAVEALVEVTALRLGSAIPGGVYMKLYAKTSGFSEVIQLFRGTAPAPGAVMTFAVAVKCQTGIDLYIEGSPGEDSISGQKMQPYMWECGFASSLHGTSEDVAELRELAAFSVKVTWRSYKKLNR